ncbi:MAG: hypothetical protein ACJ76P_05345 [Actinomycetota bacterium]
MIASVSFVLVLLGAIGAVFALLLVIGAIAGQFRRGVVSELREALATASNEIGVERGRADRLEREAGQLRQELAAIRAEVQTLRSVLRDDHTIAKRVASELSEQTAASTRVMTRVLVEELRKTVQEGVALAIKEQTR